MEEHHGEHDGGARSGKEQTPRIGAAEYRISLALMGALRSPGDLHVVMQHVMQWVRVHTGFEAIGIRLASGYDYPYFEVSGFPEEFVERERYLCARNKVGDTFHESALISLDTDHVGRPILACMCGNVLQGRTDSRLPFFTAAGSFWTNSTTELLAGTTEADRQSHTRNRCHGAGYESVGLFPLRVQGRTFGLLQVNDHQPGRFDAATIALLEQLTEVVALALSERVAEERLQRSLEEKNALLRELQHRVRNNLQTLSSLVRLQARTLRDPAAREFALNTQSRIEAMAILHDQLTGQAGIECVDMAAFIRSLASAACIAHDFPMEDLHLEVGEYRILMLPDRATALGLMANELLANSLCHAFPAGRTGTVSVLLDGRVSGSVLMRIADDGVGIAEEVPFPEASTFGLSIVELFAKQLGANVALRRSPGTTFEVVVPTRESEGAT